MKQFDSGSMKLKTGIFLVLVGCTVFQSVAQTMSNQAQDQTNYIGVIAGYLSGSWKSNPDACIGIGEANKVNKVVLDSNFFLMETKATFDVEENNRHEDKKFISYNKLTDKLILREFHSEGFVNEYEVDSMSTDLKYIVFLSRALENMPDGWKARMTIQIIDDGNYREQFDMARPGEPFRQYVVAAWRRSAD